MEQNINDTFIESSNPMSQKMIDWAFNNNKNYTKNDNEDNGESDGGDDFG